MNKRLVPAVLFTAFLLFGGCRDFFLDEPSGSSPETLALGPGEGILRISLSGAGVESVSSARTILPQNPGFTRYELVITDASSTLLEPVTFYESSTQLRLDGIGSPYEVVVLGYMGETLVAYSASKPVTIPVGGVTGIETFDLKPLDAADPAVAAAVAALAAGSDPGTAATAAGATDVPAVVAVARAVAAGASDENFHGFLNYTLGWDGLSQMPAKAELLIETYSVPPAPIPISWIPPELTVGSAPGTILLLDKGSALVKLNGSVSLPAGEYRLTVTVTMEGVPSGVSRMDIAHVYGGLTSSALFFYGSGDLISNVGFSSGPAFITGFGFEGYPNATSVIGGVPGPDGTRLIMVMLPSDADLTQLRPEVETASGVVISSPAPSGIPTALDPSSPDSDLLYKFDTGNYSGPTSWTAVDKKGNTQQYTLVVNKAPTSGHQITDLFFKAYPYAPVTIDEETKKIDVVLPSDVSDLTNLPSPVISIVGKTVTLPNGYPIPAAVNFSSTQTFRVVADTGAYTDYTVQVAKALNNDALITSFALDGYPDLQLTEGKGIYTPPTGGMEGTITGELPYGVSLSNRKPLIQFKGKTLSPDPELPQNFNGPVLYTVTAEDSTTRTYRVTLKNKPGNTDTGIFDFKLTNVPNSKVVIGRNPRSDEKIPIVIQVPYGTDQLNMIPAITLNSPTSTISYWKYSGEVFVPFNPPTPPSPDSAIDFGTGTSGEAVYRVTPQAGPYQDYVVVVHSDIQYYYVKATGSDIWPDIDHGGSESDPFKTLAYAVYRASRHPTVSKIFVIGELNDTTEGGAWEDASVPYISPESNGFHSSGGTSGSVFDLKKSNSNKRITISGVSNATLRGTAGKRVLSVTDGADLVFENITVTGGNTSTGNGGGIYISGNSKVKFSGGSITGNTACSGGGVYVEDSDRNDHYDFTLLNGSITGNRATATATNPIAGGGGIYTNGHALVWFAGGTVSNNTTNGSGGGILINGMAYDKTNTSSPTGTERGDEYGLLMSGGTISTNNSNGNASPHGGGGVYVAKGVFEMLGGEINGKNYSLRQGGGVFVWHNARFTASGTSSITGNEGVGSSKGICSRGYTEMMGRAQADKIYIWNNNDNADGNTRAFEYERDSFTLAENARAVGIVLAYDDTPTNPQTRNFITIAASVPGTDPICTIDLEGHLTDYKFKETNLNDWVGKKILEVDTTLDGPATTTLLGRFPLNTFVGGNTLSLAPYKLARGTPGLLPVILQRK